MVFACQLDSFRKTYVSKVVSCKKTNEDDGFYEVVCEDTILFPEGGGQPYDTGYINDIPVRQVLRRGAEAVMYIPSPLNVGDEVKQVVDWERRFDHMQQHSGQHLITAIINAEYKIDTTAWWLGEKVCHIELHTTKLSDEQMSNIESLCNKKILEELPVNVKLFDSKDEAIEKARTRGLPDDVTGPIRVVEIVGLEDDLCCGTHVNNLRQLQCIKLLYAEKGKKNKMNLFFLSGGRVLKYFTECLQREQAFTKLLKNEPASHVDLVEKLQLNLKIANKKLTTVFKELAGYEAKKFKEIDPQPKYYLHYNKEADSDYLDCYWRNLKDYGGIEKTLFVLAAGEEKGNGNLLLQGNPDIVKELGPQLAEFLGGKGVSHGTKFQAKVTKLINFKKIDEMVKKYLNETGEK